MKVEATLTFDTIRIRFDGVLHVAISRKHFRGLNAWTESDHKYLIEYTMADAPYILCEYSKEEYWRGVLTELDAVL